MKKKYEFKPDAAGASLLRRLYLPPKERMHIFKWMLYGVICVMLLVLQDVIFSRVRILDATTDLMVSGLLLICVVEGSRSSCVFCLVMALIYAFSGSAPGAYVVALLPILGAVISVFRESFLRSGFSSTMLCCTAGLVLYELFIFVIGLVSGTTSAGWMTAFLLTAALSAGSALILYPLMRSVAKIGGEAWKE